MKVNISIDDVSPHPKSSVRVIDRCYELIHLYPSMKFSLFVPIAYWRTVKPGTTTLRPLMIDEFPEFCDYLAKLPKDNFEICYHGLYHGIPGKSDNDEFQSLSRDDALCKFEKMFDTVSRTSLHGIMKPIFRPPAWRMSAESIKAAKEIGIEILALSPKEYAKSTYAGEDQKYHRVLYVDAAPPFDLLTYKPTVEIVYHACEWDKNYLSKEMMNSLVHWIDMSNEKVTFSFMHDMFDVL